MQVLRRGDIVHPYISYCLTRANERLTGLSRSDIALNQSGALNRVKNYYTR